MIFTESELCFLNNISKGDSLFGVHFPTYGEDRHRRYVGEIVHSLKNKGVLSAEGKLRNVGAVPIYLLEQYKQASQHVLLNHMKIALLPKGKLVTIVPVEEQYDLAIVNAVTFWAQLVTYFDYLCKTDIGKEAVNTDYMDYELWHKGFQQYEERHLLVGRFYEKKVLEEKILYWDNHNGYSYDIHKGEQKKMGPRAMRMYLMEILNINMSAYGAEKQGDTEQAAKI